MKEIYGKICESSCWRV